MEHDELSRFLQDYLGRQPRLFGIDPQEALSRLNEVMQWDDEKKTAGMSRPQAEEQGISLDPRRARVRSA
ncbi:hypothetical protein [Chromobacterium piscinae]|uniref:Uncharacterized protein n=1 Tax=Chromobacterium piscinae TaxID=686831 RepID=A0ABV0H182_9NEIS|nr:hypothetical protein [Chromobacterium piscinae]MBX9345538.1 hypothetical protein [Chromobacterium vaccinii]MCD4506851.1 hypothetical protein [Chromobacterium piscinae]MCD5326241.1 hypothetical protein [Chromobacterium piscinae]NHQ80179.1 hypothetical protein [Chromobacterium vaccinii]